MSEILVTPSVVGVSTLPIGLLIGGTILSVALVHKFMKALDGRQRQALEKALRAMPRLDSTLLHAPSLVEQQARSQMKTVSAQLEPLRLPSVEAVRLSGLLHLASAPFVVQNPVLVEQRLSALLSAQTLDEAVAARRTLTQAVHAGHRQAFSGAVAQACSNAARQIGFDRVEMTASRHGEVRVVAQNDLGQALVAEIRSGASSDPSLAAEVVGVRDGSCRQIMDAFERALAAQGVRYAPPRRRPTGGVCQLEAARALLRAAGPAAASDKRRAQRLSAKQEVLTR